MERNKFFSASALLNEEIDEDAYDEALKDIPTLKQQTEEIIMKTPTIKHDISKVAEQKALYELIKREVTSKEYNDIKNLYHEPVITSNNTLRKSIINPINYKIKHNIKN